MVRMIHNDPCMTGGPTAADMPEEGVAMMQSAGWVVDPDDKGGKQGGTARKNAKEGEGGFASGQGGDAQ